MLKKLENTAHLMVEIDALRHQVAELQGVEQRCQQAEAALQAFEERNRLMGDSTPLGIFTIDVQGGITGINRKMQKIFSRLSLDVPPSMNLFECQALAASGLVDDIRCCIDKKGPIIVEHAYVNAQRSRIHLRYYLSPIPGSDGVINGAMAIVEDNTNLKRAEEALRESEVRYRQLFQSAPIALIEWDVSRLKAHLEELRASGVTDFKEYLIRHPQHVYHCWSLIKRVDYNHAFLKLMSATESDRPSGAFNQIGSKGFLDMARGIILVAAAGNTADEREEALVTTAGKPIIVFGKSLVVSGHEDTMERVIIALMDISQRKKAERALKESEQQYRDLAFRDGLTGLYNQRFLFQSLAADIERAESSDTPLSLIFMDLDYFKNVVDTHGHLNGSRAIQKVACTINDCLKAPAYAVAYAGDEFVVALPESDQSQALQKAVEIQSRLKNEVYVLDEGIEVQLQASFGIATFPHDAKDVNDLVAAADHAMFAIKEAGKGAVGRFQDQSSIQSYRKNQRIPAEMLLPLVSQ